MARNKIKNKILFMGYDKFTGWGELGFLSKQEYEKVLKEIQEKKRKGQPTPSEAYAFLTVKKIINTPDE